MRLIALFVLVAVLAFAGCAQKGDGNQIPTPPPNDKIAGENGQETETATSDERQATGDADTSDFKPTGKILAGTTTPLIDYNKADYEAAIKTDKLVVLYFYANWCPICKLELPSLNGAFNELNNPNVIGFRVNYNDGDTDNDEKELAREYSVTYQHTKVFVKNRERILKAPDGWNKKRYLEEINKYA